MRRSSSTTNTPAENSPSTCSRPRSSSAKVRRWMRIARCNCFRRLNYLLMPPTIATAKCAAWRRSKSTPPRNQARKFLAMELQKINVKFFVAEPNKIPLTDFIDIFHGWIQATDGVYHDVADYSHMQAGLGIVLVAADANVSIDETEGRRGLLYKQKAPLQG